MRRLRVRVPPVALMTSTVITQTSTELAAAHIIKQLKSLPFEDELATMAVVALFALAYVQGGTLR